MADAGTGILGTGVQNPLANINLASASNIVAIGIVVGFVLIAIGIGLFIWFLGKRFNKKVILFENISGQGWRVSGRDKAMSVKVGDGGEEILYLRKMKVYKPAYGKKQADNEYWFAVGGDGYWYNFTLADFDKKMEQLGVIPVDRDMRYMNVAVRRNLQDRYQKQSFWEKYGGILMFFILVLVVGVMMYLLFNKFIQISDKLNTAMATANKVMEASNSVIAGLHDLGAKASLVPASTT